jgi:hypothetical protein
MHAAPAAYKLQQAAAACDSSRQQTKQPACPNKSLQKHHLLLHTQHMCNNMLPTMLQ